jgi:hypothetical protein
VVILDYTANGASIQFTQSELLLVTTLVERGGEIFGCNSKISKKLDRQFSLANLLVEEQRRGAEKLNSARANSCITGTVQSFLHIRAANE